MNKKFYSIKFTGKILKINITFAITFSLILSTIFFFAILNSFRKQIYSNIQSEEQIATKKSSSLFDNYIYQMSTVCAKFSLINNNQIYAATPDDYLKHKYFNENISNVTSIMPYIKSIDFLSKENENLTSPQQQINDQVTLGNIGYTEISIDKNYSYPYQMFLKFNDSNSVSIYNILITASTDLIAEKALDHVGTCTDMVISSDGTVLLSTKPEYISKSLLNTITNDNKSIKSGLIENDFNNSNCFISIIKSEYLNTYSVRFTPQSVYKSQLNGIYFHTVLLTACVFIISSLFCLTITLFSYKPIRMIIDNLKNYFPNDDNYQTFENEVDYINSNIINALKTRENIENELQTNTRLMQTTQMELLQSQINPHFVFNTLEAVKWLSIDSNGFGNPIEKCIVKLDSILRASINQYNNIITLEEEISLTKNYIDLMHLRYKNRFSVEYNLNNNLNNIKVIKFLLQPIMENCINHGFSNIKEGGIINLQTYACNNILNIKISDNGCGMSNEVLTNVRKNLLCISEHQSNHIGLQNTNSRIKLLYGSNYGINISSQIGKGTVCIISLPITLE